MQPQPLTPEQLCEIDIPTPTQWEMKITDVAVPLAKAMQTMAADLAKANAQVVMWQDHAAAQADQIAALKARVKELEPQTGEPIPLAVKAKSGA